MKLLGHKDSVEKAEIKANGVSVGSLIAESAIGEIPTCSFTIPPELASEFNEGGMEVDVEVIKSKSATGTIFKGKVAGVGFSNMFGALSCRVDLVHKLASDLDASSTLFPGNFPGSAFDKRAFINSRTTSSSADNKTDSTVIGYRPNGDFAKDVIKCITDYIINAAPRSSTGLDKPRGGNEIISNLSKIESATGALIFEDIIFNAISQFINQQLKSSTVSTTFWNSMSVLFGVFDLTMVCRGDGGVIVVPNFSGIRAGKNEIPKEWITSFDQSSRYERSPESVVVLVSDTPPNEQDGKIITPEVGMATISGAPKGAAGRYAVEAPPFLRMVIGSTIPIDTRKELMNKYAELVGIREIAKMKQASVVCPLILGVFPGVSARFSHTSLIKTFNGGKTSTFSKDFEGYCWKVQHQVSTEGVPKTLFSFSSVSDGSFKKPDSHPFWAGATEPEW
jgi:hypothetical protein